MVGEVGLDRSFRIPFPQPRSLDTSSTDMQSASPVERAESVIATSGADELAQKQSLPVKRKTLTPFTTSTAHQLRVLEMQFEVALEFGLNVSLHSVKAQGKHRTAQPVQRLWLIQRNSSRRDYQVSSRLQEEARLEIRGSRQC